MKGKNLNEKEILINWLKFLEIKELDSNLIDINKLRKEKGDNSLKILSVTDYHAFKEEQVNQSAVKKITFINKNILEELKNNYKINIKIAFLSKKEYSTKKKLEDELLKKEIKEDSFEWKKALMEENYIFIKESLTVNILSVNLFKNNTKIANNFPDFIESFFKIKISPINQLELYKEDTKELSFHFDLNSSKNFIVNTSAFLKYTKLKIDDLYLEKELSFKNFISIVCKKNVDSLSEGIEELKYFISKNISFSEDSVYQFDINKIKKNQYHVNFSKSILFILSEEQPFSFKSNLVNDLSLLIKEPKYLKSHMKNYLTKIVEENNDTQYMNKNILWKGAFGEYPLAKGQAIVMQEKQNKKDLIAVVGAPGTGKTTLFLSIIANEITNRALNLAKGNKDYNSSMIITSSTNKAVDNVVEEFQKLFHSRNDFYYIGGKKENIDATKVRIKFFIEEIEKEIFDEDKYSLKRNELLELESIIQDEEFRYKQAIELSNSLQKYNINSYEELKEKIEEYKRKNITEYYLEKEIKEYHKKNIKLKEEIKIATKELEEITKIKKTCFKYTEDVFFIDKEDIEIENLERKILNFKESNFFIKFFTKKSFNVKIVNFFRKHDFLKEIEDIDEAEDFLFYFNKYKFSNLNEEKSQNNLLSAEEHFSLNLNHIKNLEFNMSIMNKYSKLQSLRVQHILDNFKSYPEYFRLKKVKESRRMFELADDFIHLHILKNKTDIIKDLKTLEFGDKIYLKDKDGFNLDSFKVNKFLNNISLVYPIFTSTLASINNVIPLTIEDTKGISLYNTCLADESGMIKGHDFISAGIRANSSIVVGDPKQLEPIESIPSISQEIYKKEFFNDKEEFNEVRYNRYSILETNAYYRAAYCSFSDFEHNGAGIILDEHRRCQLDIANLFKLMAKYPADLKVETPPLSGKDLETLNNMGGKNLIFYDIKGERKEDKTNYIEEEYIEEVLDRLKEAGYNLEEDIGIITPYAPQSENLIKKYGKKIAHSEENKKIGTVHKFQGAEYKVILFSSVIFQDEDKGNFLGEAMLNVAVSRAKHLFINIGDMNMLRKKSALLEQYVSYFEKHGFVHKVNKKIDIKKYQENKIEEKLIFSCEHLDFFEKSIERAEKEIIIVSPFSFEDNESGITANIEWFNRIKEIKDKKLIKYPDFKIKLVFNYNYECLKNKNIKTSEERKIVERKMKELVSFIDQSYYLKSGTHEKILIVDKEEMVITSFNWISQNYLNVCRNPKMKNIIARRETGILTKKKEFINEYYENMQYQINFEKGL